MLTEEDINGVEALTGDHMTVMVVAMNLGGDASGDTAFGENLRERIRIHAPDGEFYQPLDPEDLPPEIRGIHDISFDDMPEMPDSPFDFQSMMQGMHTFFFPAVADPTGEGRLTVLIDDAKFVWDLPIAALLPPMVNPETGEEFPGNYRFDPNTGEPLRPRGD
jgi:hypothetical protein